MLKMSLKNPRISPGQVVIRILGENLKRAGISIKTILKDGLLNRLHSIFRLQELPFLRMKPMSQVQEVL